MPLLLDKQHLKDIAENGEIIAFQGQISLAHSALHNKTGVGHEYLGWLDLPTATTPELLADIAATASKISAMAQVLLVVGIGGSYLGASAAINFLGKESGTEVVFVGNSLSPEHIIKTLAKCDGKEVCVNVISKSGSTTEPAVAFRIILNYMEARYGSSTAERVFCTTDKTYGALRGLCVERGYKSFEIPTDIGGRYSVLTPVGLLPIAVAGGDIMALMAGARNAELRLQNPDITQNMCYEYAVIRNILQDKGKQIELFAGYEVRTQALLQWLVQLFGESDGKDGAGIFPTVGQFTTDLHSLGQYLQQGQKIVFESIIDITNPDFDLKIPTAGSDFDSIGYLEGRSLCDINRIAMYATALAHQKGGTPTVLFVAKDFSEETLGYIFYFFEKACAVGGYLAGTNPFDQPGVEGYKQNMFALLGKKGFEARRAELEKQDF